MEVCKKEVLPTAKEVLETISTNVSDDLIKSGNWVCISVYQNGMAERLEPLLIFWEEFTDLLQSCRL